MILYHHLLASLILMAPPLLAQVRSSGLVKSPPVARFDRPAPAGK
jgi:hypothetical protein